MGIFSKIKNAFFEEEEVEVPEPVSKPKIKINDYREEEIVHKIEPEEEKIVEPINPLYENRVKTPVMFDDDDFVDEREEDSIVETKETKLYGGSLIKERERTKDKFKVSPVISPVYGVLNRNYQPPEQEPEKKSLDHLFVEDRKKKVTLDDIRQKAYGNEEEELPSVYNTEEEEGPVVEKVTLGDAEEYFQDLGLEYNIDYHDKKTRTRKNEKLADELTKEDNPVEPKPKKEDYEEVDDKNLYDLIDMMYQDKE